jgi:hypothetical protein
MAGISEASRDNTGSREFFDGTVLPSIAFPSDHAVVSALFHVRRNPSSPPPAAEEPVAMAVHLVDLDQGGSIHAQRQHVDLAWEQLDPLVTNPGSTAQGPGDAIHGSSSR